MFKASTLRPQCPLWVKADICGAKRHVRFSSNSDRKSRHPQTVMSALPPKADMCGALGHVCFGPIADMANLIDFGHFLCAAEPCGRESEQ
jgi:hypothetical protein